METFYVNPEGDAMDKDQMEKQDDTFFDNPRSAKYQYGHGRYKIKKMLHRHWNYSMYWATTFMIIWNTYMSLKVHPSPTF
jgi:hypothetical protein